jgi:hypothetical protein
MNLNKLALERNCWKFQMKTAENPSEMQIWCLVKGLGDKGGSCPHEIYFANIQHRLSNGLCVVVFQPFIVTISNLIFMNCLRSFCVFLTQITCTYANIASNEMSLAPSIFPQSNILQGHFFAVACCFLMMSGAIMNVDLNGICGVATLLKFKM